MANEATIFDSAITKFRLIEAGPGSSGMAIDVHVIAPGWGSSGYYSDTLLQESCEKGVYPVGMHMHIDHPSRTAEKEHPARTILGESPLAAIFTEAGHFDASGWDGPGVYSKAKILPNFVEQIKAMDGHIGISHWVSGRSEEGCAPDKKRGKIVKELWPHPTNTVDFVTVPGADGHYRTMFSEMKVGRNPTGNEKQEEKMADKQLSIRLSEIMASDPEVVAEIRKQESESLKIEAVTKDQTAKLTEAADKIKVLEQENKDLKAKIAETRAREYVVAEVTKAKLPETSGKILTESLVKKAVLAEDGSVDAVKFGEIVTADIKAKVEEIAAIRKESGITGNGTTAPPAGDGRKALMESFVAMNVANGKTKEEAMKLAEIAAGGR